jgi:carbon-monoxide dehydrogenase iron sulfur subunit
MKRIVWDMAKCSGCRVCEAICSFVKEGEFNPVKARGKVVRTVERSILYKVRVTCLQCEEPNCMAVCPTGAITANDGGVKIVNEEKCIGCRMCEMACPVGAIAVCAEKGVSLKCDLCQGLEEPQCVKYCYTEALRYLPDERVGITLARAKSEKYLEMVTQEG